MTGKPSDDFIGSTLVDFILPMQVGRRSLKPNLPSKRCHKIKQGFNVTRLKRPPTVVGRIDGTFAILRSDGTAASFVNGKWQPGIAFDSRDFMEMSDIGESELRTRLLNEASEALEKSRDASCER